MAYVRLLSSFPSTLAPTVLEGLPVGLLVSDAQGVIESANATAASIFGFESEELIGSNFGDLIALFDRKSYLKQMARCAEKPELRLVGARREVVGIRRDGSPCPVFLTTTPLELPDHEAFVTAVTDLSQDQMRRRHNVLMDVTAACLNALDKTTLVPDVCRIVGERGLYKITWIGRVDQNDLHVVPIGQWGDVDGYLGELVGPDHEREATEAGPVCVAIRSGQSVVSMDVATDTRMAPWRDLLIAHGLRSLAAIPMRLAGRTAGVLCVYSETPGFFDSTEIELLERIAASLVLVLDYQGAKDDRQAARAEAEFFASHDQLTGLPNRVLFRRLLSDAIARLAFTPRNTAVLSLDLDRFTVVNEGLGHNVGDRLLRQVADRLKACSRENDSVARIGGDEFAILVQGFSTLEDVAVLARRLLDTLAKPFSIDGREIFVGTSIGIAGHPDDGAEADCLFKASSLALARAKDSGRNRFCFFNQDMDRGASDRYQLESDLRHLLSRNELTLHYQPQFTLRPGVAIGVEALARWKHPKFGMISPDRFIPALEQSGLIVGVGEWILHTACAQNAAWQAAGMAPLRVAVNISPHQLKSADVVATVTRVLAETGLDPRWLELEITEGTLLEGGEATRSVFKDLHGMGVRISVDDFGTGYSSLAYLKRFPVDALKIDQSFVRNLSTDPNDAAIAKAVIALAESLHLGVIAEGIETREQREFLLANGCNEGQGYLFSRPVTADDVPSQLGPHALHG
jgi:diguanylate cyclase (GGDEF)-like protein/PAS domain S-box-containing protein